MIIQSKSMQTLEAKIKSHSRVASIIFSLKATYLSWCRSLQDYFIVSLRKFPKGDSLKSEPLIASSVGNLWNKDDNNQNWRLTAGKVHNLRIAVRSINGIEVPSGEIFSFWAHIGKATKRKGYVVGRAVREGCIIPTVAGGLCQLSNALYDAALQAGFEIVERHRHSEVIKGSLAEEDRDATIKWNYVDLRFRSAHPFRIEAELTDQKIIVLFKGKKGNFRQDISFASRPSSPLNDCYSCGQVRCFTHRAVAPVVKNPMAFLLDEMWPEFNEYISTIADENDSFFCPVDSRVFRKKNYGWNLSKSKKVRTATLHTILRAFTVRRVSGKGGKALQSALIVHDRRVAYHYASRILPEFTHLVVAQNLLPALWESGVLGGRSFDVLMNRLPLSILQERLDKAYRQNPQSSTLNDFRAPVSFIENETKALERARKIITPHAEIGSLFAEKVVLLPWHVPEGTQRHALNGKKVLLAGPPLGRKGIYEVKKMADELGLKVIAMKGSIECHDILGSQVIETVNQVPFDELGLVVLPAYVEHKPRIVLKAVSMGIPAIVSDACGLHGIQGVNSIPTGDYESFKEAVSTFFLPAYCHEKN